MPRWFTDDEIEFVRTEYPYRSAGEIAAALGRPNPKSIRNLAARLGVRKERPWTTEERRVLAYQYGHAELEWLCRRLGRSRHAVMHEVRRLGLQRTHRWTPEDDAILHRELPTDDLPRVARMIGVSCYAVLGRAQRIGISERRIPTEHPWRSD